MIPEKYQELAFELAELANKYDLRKLNGCFEPGFDDEYPNTINFQWNAGRHDADMKAIHINSTERVYLNLKDRPQKKAEA